MKSYIKIYHPEEVMHYHVEKCFSKVVFQNTKNHLVVEVNSTEDLYHVDEDALQNSYPQVSFYLEDVEIPFSSLDELEQKVIEIKEPLAKKFDPTTEEEIEIELATAEIDSRLDALLYNNELFFSSSGNGSQTLLWKGDMTNFVDDDTETIPFEIFCTFEPQDEEIEDLYD